ncbi:hypothetical protein G3O08_16095 [Cryomorpha ignava]|uniref:Uncharacterized protein n=1 Tax=Cryomorpha ignava TaxID=101383 RepID=A0A7K3WTK4_9FLAO|nr:hypothetical protein [Cryomorpha ignava]NEN25023.1 hypothetical protein [Cryomorpha ignava]
MTITDFNLLSFDGKASLLNKYGKYLDNRNSKHGTKLMIYDLFGFYVEVSYRFDQRVQYIRAVNNIFESNTLLDSIKVLHLN